MADNESKEADEAEAKSDEGGSAKAEKPEPEASDDDDEDEAEPAPAKKPDKPKAKSPDKKPDKSKSDKPKASDKKPASDKSTSDKSKSDKSKSDKSDKASKGGDEKAATAAGYQPPKAVHIGGESLLDRILPHLKKIIMVAIGVGLVATVVYGYRWWSGRKQEQETEKINAIFDIARKPVIARLPNGPEPKVESFGSEKDRAAAVLDEMAKRDTDGGGPVMRGGFLLDAGKIDEAIAEYRKGEAVQGIDGVLAKEGLGIALETKASAEKDGAARNKGYEDALAVYARMQPDEHGPRRAYALYHQARMQIQLGKKAEAKDLLTKARDASAGTDLGELIEHRLASIGAS